MAFMWHFLCFVFSVFPAGIRNTTDLVQGWRQKGDRYFFISNPATLFFIWLNLSMHQDPSITWLHISSMSRGMFYLCREKKMAWLLLSELDPTGSLNTPWEEVREFGLVLLLAKEVRSSCYCWVETLIFSALSGKPPQYSIQHSQSPIEATSAIYSLNLDMRHFKSISRSDSTCTDKSTGRENSTGFFSVCGS